MSEIKLKPCPFCGGIPKYSLNNFGYYFKFKCNDLCIMNISPSAFPFSLSDFEIESMEYEGKTWDRRRSSEELTEIALKQFFKLWNKRYGEES